MSKNRGLGLKSMFGEFPERVGEVWVIWMVMLFAVLPVSRSLEHGMLVAIAPTFVACVVWWLEHRSSDEKVVRAEDKGHEALASMEYARNFFSNWGQNLAKKNKRLTDENRRLQSESRSQAGQIERLQAKNQRQAEEIRRLRDGLKFRSEQMQRLLTERGNSDGD